MLSSKPRIWKLVLLFVFGLWLVGTFAPLPDTLGEILSLAGIALLLVWNCAFLWKERRERQAEQSSSTPISSSDQA